MDLSTSLANYKVHLDTMLTNPDIKYRFTCLSWYDSLGCYCNPGDCCHVDIIRTKLSELGLKIPIRQCLKAKELRKTGVDNLKLWRENPKNMMCTRAGRIFIGSKKGGDHEIYHYPNSEWSNPYKVKK